MCCSMDDLSLRSDYSGFKCSFLLKSSDKSLKINSILNGCRRNNNMKFDDLAFESKKNSHLTD